MRTPSRADHTAGRGGSRALGAALRAHRHRRARAALAHERGEVVGCCDERGAEIARGLVNYSSAETRRILKTPSSEIEAKLGYIDEPELIHRDNLVLL